MAPEQTHKEAEEAVSELTAVPFRIPDGTKPATGQTPSDIVLEKTREAEKEVVLTLHLSERLQGREKENQAKLAEETDAAVMPTIGTGLGLEARLDSKLKRPVNPLPAALAESEKKTDDVVAGTLEHAGELQQTPSKEEVGKPLVKLEQRAIALRRQNLGSEWGQATAQVHKAIAEMRKQGEQGIDVTAQTKKITKTLEEFEKIAETTRDVNTKAALHEFEDESRELRNLGAGEEWRKATESLCRDIAAARKRFEAGEKATQEELGTIAKRFEYLKQATTILSTVRGRKATAEASRIYARGLDALAQGKTGEAELQRMLGRQYAADREQRTRIGKWSSRAAAGQQEAVAKELGMHFSRKLDDSGIKDKEMQGSLAAISKATLIEPTIGNLKRAEEAVNAVKEFRKADGLVEKHGKEERERLTEINRRILSGIAGSAPTEYVRAQRKLADMYTYARRYTLPTSRNDIGKTRRAKRNEINRLSERLKSAGIEKMRSDLEAYTSINGFLHASTKQQKIESRRANAAAEGMYSVVNEPVTNVLQKIADGTPLTEQDKHTMMLGGFLSAEAGGLGAMFATSQQDAAWYGSMFEGVPSAQKTLAGLRGPKRETVAGLYMDAAQSYLAGNHDAACAQMLAARGYAAAKTDVDKDRILELAGQIKEGEAKIDVIQWELRTKIERIGLESRIEDEGQRNNMKDYYDMSAAAYRSGDAEGAKIVRNIGDMYGRAAVINDGSPAVAEGLGLAGGETDLPSLEQLKANYSGDKSKTFGELRRLSPEETQKGLHILNLRLGAVDARINATEFRKRKAELGDRRERAPYEKEILRLQQKSGKTIDQVEKERLADESGIVDVKRNQERHAKAVENYDLAVELYEKATKRRLQALETADETKRNQLISESDQLFYRSSVLMQAAEGQQQALSGIDKSVRNVDSINRESGRSSFNRAYGRFSEMAVAVKETEKPDMGFTATQNARAGAGTRSIVSGSLKVEQQLAIAATTKRIISLNRKRTARNRENAEHYGGIKVANKVVGQKKKELGDLRRSQREKELKLAAERAAIGDMEKQGQGTTARRNAMGRLVVSKSKDRRRAEKLEKEIEELEEQAENAYDAEAVQKEIDRSTRLARREKFTAADRAGKKASFEMNYGAERARISSQHWNLWHNATPEEQKGQMDEFKTFDRLAALDKAKSLAQKGRINGANAEIARLGEVATIEYERQHRHNIGNRHLARAEAAEADKKRNHKPVPPEGAAKKGIGMSPGAEQKDAAAQMRDEMDDAIRKTGIYENLDKDADELAARERELAKKAFEARDSVQSLEDARGAQELRSRLVIKEATVGLDIAKNPAEFERNTKILAKTYGFSEVAAAGVLHDIVERGSQLSYEEHATGWNLTRIAADKALDALSEADQLKMAGAGSTWDRDEIRNGPATKLIKLAVAASRDPAHAARTLKEGGSLHFTVLKDEKGGTSHAFRLGSKDADNFRIEMEPERLNIIATLYESGAKLATALEKVAEKGEPGAIGDAQEIAAAEVKLELLNLGIDASYNRETREWKTREVALTREEQEALTDALGTAKQNRANLFITATRLGRSGWSRDDGVEAINELKGIASAVGTNTKEIIAIADERNNATAEIWEDDSLSYEEKRVKVAALEDKYREMTQKRAENIASVEGERMRRYDSLIEEGESDAKIAMYSETGIKMVTGGLLTATGAGSFVASYFFVEALKGFNEQRVMSGGYDYLTTNQKILGWGGIGLAAAGIGLSWGQAIIQGVGNEALMVGRTVGIGEELAGLGRLSRIGAAVQTTAFDALKYMPRALQIGGIGLMAGGAGLGVLEIYDLKQQMDAGAGVTGFDMAFSVFNTVQPALQMGGTHVFRIKPSLATSRSFGARAYRGFMMVAFGATREEMHSPALLARQERHARAMGGAAPEVRESIGNIEMGLGRQLDVNEISILRENYKGRQMDVDESIAMLRDYDTYVNGGTKTDEYGRTVRVKGVVGEAYGKRVTELDIMGMERMAPEITSEQAIAAANHFGDKLATVPKDQIHKFLEDRPITGSTKGKYKTLEEFAADYKKPVSMKERAARAKAKRTKTAGATPAEAFEIAGRRAAKEKGITEPQEVKEVVEETKRLQDEYKRYVETPPESRDSAGISPEMAEKFERIRIKSESVADLQNNLALLAAETVIKGPEPEPSGPKGGPPKVPPRLRPGKGSKAPHKAASPQAEAKAARTDLEPWRALESPEVLETVAKGVEDAVDRSIAGNSEKTAEGVLKNSKNNLSSKQLIDEAEKLESAAIALRLDGKETEAKAIDNLAEKLRQEANTVKKHEDLGFRAGGNGTFVYKDRVFLSAEEVETAAALVRSGKQLGELGKVKTMSLKDYTPSAEDKRTVVVVDRNRYEKAKKTLDMKTKSSPGEYADAMHKALGVGENAVIAVEDSPYETVLVNNRMVEQSLADERGLITYKDNLELYTSLAEGSARGISNALQADGYGFNVIDGQYVGIVSMDKGKTWLLNKLRHEFGDMGLLVYFKAIRELKAEFAESIGRANIPTVKLTRTGDEVVIVVPERFALEYAEKHGGPTTIPEAIEFTIKAYNDALTNKVKDVAGRFGFETPKLSEAMTDYSADIGVVKLKLEAKEPPQRIVFVDEGKRRGGVPTEYRDLGTLLNGIEVRARIDKVTKPDASGKATLTEEQGNILKGVARTKGPRLPSRRAAPDAEPDLTVEMRGVSFTDENAKKAFEEFTRASGKGVANVANEMVGPSVANLFGHDAGDVLKNGTIAIQRALERHGLADRVEAVSNGAAKTEFFIKGGDKEATLKYIKERVIPEAQAEATQIFREMKIQVKEAGFEAPFPINEVRMYAGENAWLQAEADMMYGRVDGQPAYNAEMDVVAGQVSAVMHLAPDELMPGVGSPEKWARDPSAVAHYYRQKGIDAYPEIFSGLAEEKVFAGAPEPVVPQKPVKKPVAMPKAAGAEEVSRQAPTRNDADAVGAALRDLDTASRKARKRKKQIGAVGYDIGDIIRKLEEPVADAQGKVDKAMEKFPGMEAKRIARMSIAKVKRNAAPDENGNAAIYLVKGKKRGRARIRVGDEVYSIVEKGSEGATKALVAGDHMIIPKEGAPAKKAPALKAVPETDLFKVIKEKVAKEAPDAYEKLGKSSMYRGMTAEKPREAMQAMRDKYSRSFSEASDAERAIIINEIKKGKSINEAFDEMVRAGIPAEADPNSAQFKEFLGDLRGLSPEERRFRIQVIDQLQYKDKSIDPRLKRMLDTLAFCSEKTVERFVSDWNRAEMAKARFNEAEAARQAMTPKDVEMQEKAILREIGGEELENVYTTEGKEGVLKWMGIEVSDQVDTFFDMVVRGKLGERLGSEPGFEGTKIRKVKHMVGATGAYQVEMSNGKRIFVKAEDAAPGIIGRELAIAEGMYTAEIHVHSYDTGIKYADGSPVKKHISIIEDVHDIKGKTIKVRFPDGKAREVKVTGVARLEDILNNPNPEDPVHRRFYSMLKTDEGRQQLFEAWNAYHELSRRAGLRDKYARNTVIETNEDGSFTFQPFDMDDMLRGIGVNNDGTRNYNGFKEGEPWTLLRAKTSFEGDFAAATVDFMDDITKATEPARKEMLKSLGGPEEKIELDQLMEARNNAKTDMPADDSTTINAVEKAVEAHDGELYGFGRDASGKELMPGMRGTGIGDVVDQAGRGSPIVREDGRVVFHADEVKGIHKEIRGRQKEFWDSQDKLISEHVGRIKAREEEESFESLNAPEPEQPVSEKSEEPTVDIPGIPKNTKYKKTVESDGRTIIHFEYEAGDTRIPLKVDAPIAEEVFAGIRYLEERLPAAELPNAIEGYARTMENLGNRLRISEKPNVIERSAREKVVAFAAELHANGVDANTIFSNERGTGLMDVFPITDERAYSMLAQVLPQLSKIFRGVPRGGIIIAREQRGRVIPTTVPRGKVAEVTLSYILDDVKKMDSGERFGYLYELAARFRFNEQIKNRIGEYTVDNKGNPIDRPVKTQKLPFIAYLMENPEHVMKALDNSEVRDKMRDKNAFRQMVKLIGAMEKKQHWDADDVGLKERQVWALAHGAWLDLVNERLGLLALDDASLQERGFEPEVKTKKRETISRKKVAIRDFITEVMPELNRLWDAYVLDEVNGRSVMKASRRLKGHPTRNEFKKALGAEFERLYHVELDGLGTTPEFAGENLEMVFDISRYHKAMESYSSGGRDPARKSTEYAGSDAYMKTVVDENSGEMVLESRHKYGKHQRPEAFDEVLPIMREALEARSKGREEFRDFKFSEEFRKELNDKFKETVQYEGQEMSSGEAIFNEWKKEHASSIKTEEGTFKLSESGDFETGFYGGNVRGTATCQDPKKAGLGGFWPAAAIAGTVELPWTKQVVIPSNKPGEFIYRRRLFLVEGEKGPVLLVQPEYHQLGNVGDKINDAVIASLKERYEPLGVEVRDIKDKFYRAGAGGLKKDFSTDVGINTGYRTFKSGRAPFFYMDSNPNKMMVGGAMIAITGLHARKHGESVEFPGGWNGQYEVLTRGEASGE